MEAFLKTVAGVLEVPAVTAGTDFRSGPIWDSLTAFALRVMIQQRYGRALSAEQLKAMNTVGELAAFAGVSA